MAKSKPVDSTAKSARKVVRHVTQSVLRFAEDEARTVKILEAMRISAPRNPDSKRAKAMGPATVMACVDIDTGEEGLVICNKVLASSLTEAYPADAYVGKVFEITIHAKRKGERFDYRPVDVIEVSE